MTRSSTRPSPPNPPGSVFGLLREYVARTEIAELSGSRESAEDLIGRASLRLSDALDLEAALRELAAGALREPARTAALVEAFVRRTSPPNVARGDLRMLRKSRGKLPSVAALAERVAIRRYRLELAAEVALAQARDTIGAASMSPLAFEGLTRLARQPGRYSRRVEALRLMEAYVEGGLERARGAAIAGMCHDLSAAVEHRWVQPAAIALLGAVDAPAAIALARQRLERAGPGDDFLVRERIVDLAADRGGAWTAVVELAAKDASEHVRLTAARRLTDEGRLAELARVDASAKVRACALLTLSSRSPDTCFATLASVLARDRVALAVETAAQCLTTLARDRRLAGARAAEAVSVLARTASRADLPEKARVAIVEELGAVTVLCDPHLRVVHDLLEDVLQKVPVGGAVKVAGAALEGISDEQMGRVLSVLARDDFGLSAERRSRGGFTIYRGEDRLLRLWRVLLELRRPLPSKRQGYSHGWGRALRGSVRAPPRRLAELTVTNVPGERVLVAKRGDWGRHLPLVDDLLALRVLVRENVALYGPAGRTSIEPPASFGARVLARLMLTLRYAPFVEQRRRALESEEPAVQRGYVEQIARSTGVQIRFEPYPFASSLLPAEVPKVGLSAVLLAASPVAQIVDGISDLGHYALRAEGNRLPHVAAYAAITLLGMLARGAVIRRRIELDRRAIPLVVGGWGTRGKSGTERLKAGLFQGLGYEVLVKTTGCEAMFIHAVPGLRAQEVFIYRPYDKATIWEQRELLRLGRRFNVRTFLWECMALQPDLVNLLQGQWMRDDYSTITNAYPDHEDVQGPAGQDVAEVISEFIPHGGRLLTSEDQMLPILAERAKRRNTSIHAVTALDSALIADDILARFPYHEHPNNIALVSALARTLGVPESIAVVEMADNVVPDLGVLKTYPRVEHAGRSMAFTNGMSANERTGALSNWTRMDLDKHDLEADPKRWIVTVVNNRADRVARSEVFARFIVDDIAAHQHVLIGTNVSGLMGFIREALDRHLRERSPVKELGGTPAEQQAIIANRIDASFARLKIAAATVASVTRELAELGLPALDPRAIAQALAPAAGETLAQASERVRAAMPPGLDKPALEHVVDTIARRRVAEGVRAFARESGLREGARLDAMFRDRYRELFLGRVIAINDAAMTGDQLIDRLAKAAPPGARIDVMGVQNIKGTGLDFVYRWVSLDTVNRALGKARSDVATTRDEGLKELYAHDDYGLVDSAAAVHVLEGLKGQLRGPGEAELVDMVLGRLRGIAERRSRGIAAQRVLTLGDRARLVFGATFDYLDSMRRQSAARRVLDELVGGHISHAAAALEMRSILARAKGAWALAKRS